MKEPSKVTQFLDSMWEFKTDSKRSTIVNWRRLFKAYGFQPKGYLAVLWLGNGHYAVESRSRAGQSHSVEMDEAGELHCVCEDFTINKNKNCEHVKHVRRMIETGILPNKNAK